MGQCSLTVALPILSASGNETCILPSAVLSTHTAGFTGFTVRDLADDMPAIRRHWIKENIKFDCVYTGYLGSKEQIDYVLDIIRDLSADNSLTVIDPAMGDNGKLYPAFDAEYAREMRRLVGVADVTLPNITEACYLTGTEYKDTYDKDYVVALCEKLLALGAKKVVLTGVGYVSDKLGVVVYDKNSYRYYEHERIQQGFHGTGDVYASAFTGALVNEFDAYDAAVIAADFTVKCIKKTLPDKTHTYGVKFEPLLGEYAKTVGADKIDE